MHKTLASIDAFRAKCEKASFAANAKSPYDPIMYDAIPKSLALSRLAVWGGVLDIHRADSVLTDGQITTIVDAAPSIVGAPGLKKLALISSHPEMDSFIRQEAPSYGPGIIASAQLWSLFHLTTRTWPDHLFRDSVVLDEGGALLGLVAAHLQSGDFTRRDFKPRQFLMGIIAKSHQIAEAAKSGHPSANPDNIADASATFIALIRDGNYEAAAFSGLAGRFPEAPCTAALAKLYKISKTAGEVDFVRPDDVVSDRDLSSAITDESACFDGWGGELSEDISDDSEDGKEVAGGDGAFLGYRSLHELKQKFNGSGVTRGGLPMASYMKRHPFGHATICQWMSQAMRAEALGGVEANDVFAAALEGKSEFIEKYSPVFSPGFKDDTLGKKGKGATAKKTKPIVSDFSFEPTSATSEMDMFAVVQGFRAARFADSNHFSNKRVMLLFDEGHSLIRGPNSVGFKRLQSAYHDFLSRGNTHDDAVELAVGELRREFPDTSDEDFHAWRGFLGRVVVESLDAKVAEDSFADAHNMLPHDVLEEYSDGAFRAVASEIDDVEVEVHSSMMDLSETRASRVGLLENAFIQMHAVLIENDHEELAEALDRMSYLSLPSKADAEEIIKSLVDGSDSLVLGRALGTAFRNSYNIIEKAVVSQTVPSDNELLLVEGDVRRAAEEGAADVIADKQRPAHVRMAERMGRVLRGAHSVR